MKIAIVCPYFSPNIPSNELGLANTFRKLGHDVTVYTTKSKAPRDNSIPETTSDFNIKYSSVLFDLPDNPIVKDISPDILDSDVIFLQEDYPTICHKAFRKNTPTILSIERYYYPSSSIKNITLKAMDFALNNRLINKVDIITTHTRASRDFLLSRGITKPIHIIPVGIDTELFKPIPTSPHKNFKILTIARLHKYKGLEYLIRAFKMVTLIAHQNIYLSIIGVGDEYNNLLTLIKYLNLEDKVFISNNFIPYQEIPQIIPKCDLYVQPSLIEPFGITVLEAMSCGKPIIASSVGGLKDTIRHNYNGILVIPRDIDGLYKAIINIMEKDCLRTSFSENSRKRALEYDWNNIAQKYMELI